MQQHVFQARGAKHVLGLPQLRTCLSDCVTISMLSTQAVSLVSWCEGAVCALSYRLSMVTQRVVNVERKLRQQAEALAAEKAEETERLKGELTVLQVSLVSSCCKPVTCELGCSPTGIDNITWQLHASLHCMEHAAYAASCHHTAMDFQVCAMYT